METINNLYTREFVQSQIAFNVNVGSIGQLDKMEFPTKQNIKTRNCDWQFQYCPAKDANVTDPTTNGNLIKMSIEFNQTVQGKLFVESNVLPTQIFDIPKSSKFHWDYLPYKDVYAAIFLSRNMKIKVSVELFVALKYIPEISSDFEGYNEIPTDFEIHCENKQYKVHKGVLSKISPVFEAMLHHNFVEKSSNKLEITDFDFQTIETAFNIIYGRPCCKLLEIPVDLVISILYFAKKYLITGFLDKLEKVPVSKLSITNFCAVTRYVADHEKPEQFAICANFFKLNEETIKSTKEFAALPAPLRIKLYKIAYQFETQIDAFFYMLETGFSIGFEHMKITTPADFVKAVLHAWKYSEADLKMTCAKYFQENRDKITESSEYDRLSGMVQYSLNVLGSTFKTVN